MQIARFIPSEVNEKRDVLQRLKSARGCEQLRVVSGPAKALKPEKTRRNVSVFKSVSDGLLTLTVLIAFNTAQF